MRSKTYQWVCRHCNRINWCGRGKCAVCNNDCELVAVNHVG